MTRECKTCGESVLRPCSDETGVYQFMRERSCLLSQRDSRDATIRHLRSQFPKSSTATLSSPRSDKDQLTTDLLDSTLLSIAETVITKSNLPEPRQTALKNWLTETTRTDYNLSLAIAWDIQKAILDATMAAHAAYSGSETRGGVTSQFPKASPNPTTAPAASAQDEKIGAAESNSDFDLGFEAAASGRGAPLFATNNPNQDLVDAVREAQQDACDYDGFSPSVFLESLDKLGYSIIEKEGLAKQGGTNTSEPVWTFLTDLWKWQDYLIIPRNNSTQFECRVLNRSPKALKRGGPEAYYRLLALHNDLLSAQHDCETHHIASQGPKHLEP